MKKFTAFAIIVLSLIICFSFSVFAEPTDAFTHVETQKGKYESIVSREMYHSTRLITAGSLGLDESFLGISDIALDDDNNVYILLGERSSVVVLNPDYSYKKTIRVIDESGAAINFDGSQGLFIEKGSRDVYICDTNNSRILIADNDGKFIRYLDQPDSSLLPEDFYYQPYRLVKDDKGYLYIISQGCYYGALSYGPDGEFLGFYGANNVKASALDTLSFLWDKLTQTDEKKAVSLKTLPYSFVDLALDGEGYMVTCTGKTAPDDNGTGQIRKLSPGGGDILYKRATDGSSQSSNSFNFLESKILKRSGNTYAQDIVSVDTDSEDFIYALDQTYGLIYVYDTECNLLGGFGGGHSGASQIGVFSKPVSLAVHGDSVLVADLDNLSVTVFEITEYGKLLKEAQSAYVVGDYEGSKELWKKVLSFDANNQLAFRGLAMAALTEEDYETALDYAKKGLDYTVYDLAWQKVVSERINKYFIFIFPVALLLLGGIIAFFVIMKKKNKVLIKNIKVKTALRSVIHPFDSFNEMKYKSNGSIVIAVVLTVLLYISKMLEKTASGFLFMNGSPSNYNMLYTLLGTVGLVLLWSIANWLVASLADGKGNLKEVYIATTYSLIPYIVFTFVSVILSHFLPMTGIAILNGISTAVMLYTFFLLSVALMAMHEYDFFKFFITGVVTVLFMLLIVFVIFLIGTLSQQIVNFFVSIYTEMFFR